MTVRDTKAKERFGLRQWVELLLGASALVVSAISLWVAIGTEQANRQMVAAASWPLLQADTSDLPENGTPTIAFTLINGGVGPAKLKTLEIWWRGKPYRGAVSLLEACCGYTPYQGPPERRTFDRTVLLTGGVRNVVILAAEKRSFLRMPLGPDNAAVWAKLDSARRELKFRACYCSVFDDCWISNLQDVEPKRVDICRAVAVQYVE